MAHKVKFLVPERALGTAGVESDVHKDERMLGILKISKGSLVWFPSQTRYGHKIGWGRFDQLVVERAKRFEVR